MGTASDDDRFAAALIEGDGTRSRLERLIWTHLLKNPGSTGAELRAIAQEHGVSGDVNLVLYRALERGEIVRSGSRTPRWSIAPGQFALGPAPDGSTAEQVVEIYLAVAGQNWSPAQVRAALLSDRIIKMTAFNPEELGTSLADVVGSAPTDDVWELWFRRASRLRTSSIIV